MGPDSPVGGSTTMVRVEKKSKPSVQTVLHELSTIPLMRGLPPEEMHALVPHVEAIEIAAGTTLLQAGSEDHSLYLVCERELDGPAAPSGDTLRTVRDRAAVGHGPLSTGAWRDPAVRGRD